MSRRRGRRMIGATVGRRGGHVDAAFLWVAAGALAAGFVTGLAGFGVGIVALGFWLHVMEPVVAGPLVAICSVAGQVRSIVMSAAPSPSGACCPSPLAA